jgi:hypothetical protein
MPRQDGRGAAVNEAGGGIQCAQCGTTNMSISAFCHACGCSLRKPSTPVAPPSWQPPAQDYTQQGGQGSSPPYQPPTQSYAPSPTAQVYMPPTQNQGQPGTPSVQGYAQGMNPQGYTQPQTQSYSSPPTYGQPQPQGYAQPQPYMSTPGYGATPYETPANPYGQPMQSPGPYAGMPPPSAYTPYGQPISINVSPTMMQNAYNMPAQPPVVMVQDASVQHSLLVRALWFIMFGAWFGAIATVVGWILCVMVITLPLGLLLLNRLPQIMTLRPPSTSTRVTYANGVTMITTNLGAAQPPFLLRAIYFVFVGWWLSALWLALAWAFVAVTPITLGTSLVPAFMMFNRVPQVMTLRVN